MALKVMVSSVRRGLAVERDAMRPVIKILGYQPIRFEDFTALPVPPRAACVEAVTDADIYLLLLGEVYGDRLPDSGLSPTAEEWTVARNLGKPVVAFRKDDINPEPRQAEFIAEVEAYRTGVFRGTFSGLPDLLEKLGPALTAASEALQPLTPRPLATPVVVPWRDRERGFGVGSILETHVLPTVPGDYLPATLLPELARRLARTGREHGFFEETQALANSITEDGVSVAATPDGRRPDAGIRARRDGGLTIWESIPMRAGIALLDEAQFRARVTRDLRLGASLALVPGDDVAIAIGLDRVNMLGIPTGPTSTSLPFTLLGDQPVHVEPTDAVPVRALGVAAAAIAAETVARLLLRLHTLR